MALDLGAYAAFSRGYRPNALNERICYKRQDITPIDRKASLAQDIKVPY
jgi:hypothetical protein